MNNLLWRRVTMRLILVLVEGRVCAPVEGGEYKGAASSGSKGTTHRVCVSHRERVRAQPVASTAQCEDWAGGGGALRPSFFIRDAGISGGGGRGIRIATLTPS